MITCNEDMKGIAKICKIFSFWATLWGLRGNVHSSSMGRWKARGRLPIGANELFSPAITVEALWADIGRNCGVRKELDHFECKSQGNGGCSPTTLAVRKLESPELSRGVVCVILRLAVWYNTGVWQTDRHTHGHTWWLIPAHS